MEASKADQIRSYIDTPGFTTRDIALLVGCSERFVRYVKSGRKKKTSAATSREYLKAILAELQDLRRRVNDLEIR